ncbi:arsenate reductase (glutaredoxin) [Winogradskyella sp. A3E31]|uniref:arsenate reductase (glutaredoxin) n=1 Tax=Winogradskyella sp. A3E31 TaxID=3349637 RepID=UPI00398B06C3
MIEIYHNPRCSKSRQGIALLESYGAPFKVVRYLDNTPNEKELESLIDKLNIKPIELVRKNEAIWKSDFKSKDLTDSEIISAMAQHPKLIERPIVVKGRKAVIGRPTEKISTLL